MIKQNIGISSDCVSDLPKSYADENDIGIMHVYVNTETGRFIDDKEISSQNVVELYRKGHSRIVTDPASAEEYAAFFRERLNRYSEIIHITAATAISGSYKNATAALDLLGSLSERVKVVDSGSVSAGLAYIVIKANEFRGEGLQSDEIVKKLDGIISRICLTFFLRDTEHMFRNGRVGKAVNRLCRSMGIHPEFEIRSGRIRLKLIRLGDMKRATKRYIKWRLRKRSVIDEDRIIAELIGFGYNDAEMLIKEVERRVETGEVLISEPSASVASNSGTEALILVYLK